MGLLEMLQPRNLGQVMTPDVMRAQLLMQLRRQGRTDIDVNKLSPDQMQQMLRTIPADTVGIRG